jgi:hypothetical protein
VADDPDALARALDLGREPRRDTWLLWGFVVTLAVLVAFVVFVAWQVAEMRAMAEAIRLCAARP